MMEQPLQRMMQEPMMPLLTMLQLRMTRLLQEVLPKQDSQETLTLLPSMSRTRHLMLEQEMQPTFLSEEKLTARENLRMGEEATEEDNRSRLR
jgi:hypothetical protein